MENVKFTILVVFFISTINLLESAHSPNNNENTSIIVDRIKSLVIVIVSQGNSYHHEKALKLQEELYLQADQISQSHPVIHLTHINFPHVGAWTITPIIPKLATIHRTNTTGVLFIQDSTFVNLEKFLSLMAKYENQMSFVGHALCDNEPSIIHHFAFYDDPKRFKYPNAASGFFITSRLLLNLSERIINENPKTDFNIDAAHELALFIWDGGNGTELIHESKFCADDNTEGCFTYPRAFTPCGETVQKDEIYFAVKTCRKFHSDRVRVVQSTWAKHATHINYFSDHADNAIPTIDLGVPNTEQGHCEKTFSILRYVQEGIRKLKDNKDVAIKWIVLVDDDTILSVAHVARLLACYNPNENVVLGERYGYGVRAKKGYNYVTGGGGTVISLNLLPLLVDLCECPSANTPDDMYLGFCLHELGIDLVHSPLFHQARPNDYPKGYLKSHQSNTVSFHKHWMIDPVNVYKEWFEEADILDINISSNHEEL